MNDLATLTGQPRPIVAGGITYQVFPFAIADLGKLQAWVDSQYQDPLAIAAEKMGLFTVPQQKHLLAMALEQASKPKPRIGSDEADALIRSVDGMKEMLFIGISKGDPSFTREQADAVFAAISETELANTFKSTGVDKVLSDPKAPTSGEPT